MFIGKKRSNKVREYRRPAKLQEVLYHNAFYDRLDFSSTPSIKYDAAISSLGTHPSFPNNVYVGTFHGIERRIWTPMSLLDRLDGSEDRVKISKFEDFSRAFYSISFRADGQVFLSGTSKHEVFLFGSGSDNLKTPLKTIRIGRLGGNKSSQVAVKMCKFLRSPDLIITGSDAGETHVVNVLKAKSLRRDDVGDYVRCGAVLSEDEYAVGSYNHTVKLYDVRVSERRGVVVNMKQSNPVECMEYDRRNEVLIVAESGGALKLYDKRKLFTDTKRSDGVELIPSSESNRIHTKTIMDIRKVPEGVAGGTGTYYVTAGLDGRVNIISLRNKKYKKGSNRSIFVPVKTFNFDQPVMMATIVGDGKEVRDCIYLADNSKQLVCGEAIYKRRLAVQKEEELLVTKNYHNLISFNLLNQVNKINNRMFLKKSRILELYGNKFAHFRYKEALLHAIDKYGIKEPIVVFSLIQELKNRNELLNALDNKTEIDLHLILLFVDKYIDDEKFTSMVTNDLLSPILKYYSGILGKSERIDTILSEIQKKLKEVIEKLRELQKVKGIIDIMMLNSINSE